MKPDWFLDWSTEVCALVASGPSVTAEAVSALRSRCKIAVVNNGYQLAPWADALYAADGMWWNHHAQALSAFPGLKVTCDEDAARYHKLKLVRIASVNVFSEEAGVLGHGGNGGFQLANLVTQFGCRRQIWLGFDFCGEHWHGKHPDPLRNPRQQTMDKWRARFDEMSETLTRAGVNIRNVSTMSALTAYPKCSLDEAIAEWL